MTASILVVDDKDLNIRLLKDKLEKEYYSVLTANSGAAALEILDKNKIDLVLLDVMMPNMDGFETCKRIKANPQLTHIPVIIVTALSDVEDKIKGLEAGADEFLTKPITNIPLLPRVESLCRMKFLIDELKLRNNTNQELGISTIEINDDFHDNNILLINDDILQTSRITSFLSKVTTNIKVVNKITDDIPLPDSYVPDLIIICWQSGAETDPLRTASILKSKENCKYAVFMIIAEVIDDSEKYLGKSTAYQHTLDERDMVVQGIKRDIINDYFLLPENASELNELVARARTQLRKKRYQDNLRNSLDQSVNLSIKDGLTNVFNRRYLDLHILQMIKRAKENSSKLSIMMLDIDHFKNINDVYGHQEGDMVLKAFSTIIKNSTRIIDLVARYGGEEFAVLLGNTSLDEAEKIALRLREDIKNARFQISDSDTVLNLTASIGIAEYNYGESAESLIERVDSALYRAKHSGRDRVEKFPLDNI